METKNIIYSKTFWGSMLIAIGTYLKTGDMESLCIALGLVMALLGLRTANTELKV